MKRRDFLWRAAGVAILVGACATGFAEQHLLAGTWHDTAFSLALALAGFASACLGTLLLFRGSRVRRSWLAACERTAARREAETFAASRKPDPAAQINPALLWDPGLGGGRMAMTTYLILCAQQQESQTRPSERPRHAAAASNPSLQRERC